MVGNKFDQFIISIIIGDNWKFYNTFDKIYLIFLQADPIT